MKNKFMQNKIKYNAPMRKLLRYFEDKGSGMVVESRREIRRRFDYIDHSQQVRFLKACLNSGKLDREWAYQKLFELWDARFEAILLSCLNQYQEKGAAVCLAKHGSTETVLRELQNIDNENTHYYLCLRFVDLYGFKIDTSKLTPLQVLSVYTKTNYMPSAAEVSEQLHRLAVTIADNVSVLMDVVDNVEDVSCEAFEQFGIAKYLVAKLQQYEVLDAFCKWNKKVTAMVKNSNEYSSIIKMPLSGYDFRISITSIFKEYIRQNLP